MKNDNPLYKRLPLKIIVSFLVVLFSQCGAIISAYGLKNNTPAVISVLILLHCLEIVSYVYMTLNLYLLSRTGKKFSIFKYLSVLVLGLIIVAILLESFLLSA